MKRIFFASIILICLINISNAQELSKSNTVSNQELNTKDWRLMLQVTGPSQWTGSVNAVKPISDKWYIRIGAAPIVPSSKLNQHIPDRYYSINEQISRRNAWGAELGIGPEYHLNTKGKLDPFIGMGTNFVFSLNKAKSKSKTELSKSNTNGLTREDRHLETNNAALIKINPFGSFGVNYYINPRFAIGAEYGIGPSFDYKSGIDKFTNEKLEVSKGERKDNKLKSLDINLRQIIGLHFIYVFDKKEK